MSKLKKNLRSNYLIKCNEKMFYIIQLALNRYKQEQLNAEFEKKNDIS